MLSTSLVNGNSEIKFAQMGQDQPYREILECAPQE